MADKAFQDFYPDEMSYCYGCGRLNERGHQIKSYWDGEESVCTFQPKPYHTAVPGYVYGGLLASLVDCHGTGTAAAAANRVDGISIENGLSYRYVTASLQVNYLKPTPLGPPLILRGHVKELKGRKAVIAVNLYANGELCVQGEVIAVQIPENMLANRHD